MGKLSALVVHALCAASVLRAAHAEGPYWYTGPDGGPNSSTLSGLNTGSIFAGCIVNANEAMRITKVELYAANFGSAPIDFDTKQYDIQRDSGNNVVANEISTRFSAQTGAIPVIADFTAWTTVADFGDGVVIPAGEPFCIGVTATSNGGMWGPIMYTSPSATMAAGVTASTVFFRGPSTIWGDFPVEHAFRFSAPPPPSPSPSPSASVSASVSPSASASASPSVSPTPSPSPVPPCAVKARYIRVQRPAMFPLAVDEVIALDDSRARKNVARAAAVRASSTLLKDTGRFGPQFVVDGKINDRAMLAAGGVGAWQPATDLGESEVLTLTWPGAGVRLSELQVYLRMNRLTADQRRAINVEVEINGGRGCRSDFARGRITGVNETGPWAWTLPRPILVKTVTLRRTTALHVGELEVTGYPLEGATFDEMLQGMDLLTLARQRGAVTASASSIFIDNRIASSFYAPRRAIDGQAGTFWHSKYTDRTPTWILDLGAEYMVQKVKVWARRDMGAHRTMGASVTLLDGAKKAVGAATNLVPSNYVVTGPQTGCPAAAAIGESYGWWRVASRCPA